MRFPRALGIREDLGIADCMPASGACYTSGERKVMISLLAVFENVRSDKKRKMEDDTEYVLCMVSVFSMWVFTTLTARQRRRRRRLQQKLNPCSSLFAATQAQQATVLPQYQGLSKKGIAVEGNMFEGMKFGTRLIPLNVTPRVVLNSWQWWCLTLSQGLVKRTRKRSPKCSSLYFDISSNSNSHSGSTPTEEHVHRWLINNRMSMLCMVEKWRVRDPNFNQALYTKFEVQPTISSW